MVGGLSTKCNTLGTEEYLSGSSPTETFSRTIIDQILNDLNIRISNRTKIKSFFEKETNNIISVLISASLPGLVRLSEIHFCTKVSF